MKKILYIGLPLIALLIAAAFIFYHGFNNTEPELQESTNISSNDQTTDVSETASQVEQESQTMTNENDDSIQTDNTQDNFESLEVLKSVSVDLDNDGKSEIIDVGRIPYKSDDVSGYEGRLRITAEGGIHNIPFVIKAGDITGLYKDISFEDLDGDSVKDIFITVQEVGNPFTVNNFFMYNYKTGEKFSYPEDSQDINLVDFASNFLFSYEGEGMLSIINIKYNFEGKIDLTDNANFSDSEDINKLYERSWVDPVPVEIDEYSGVSLVKNNSEPALIKIPLPVFGQATVDLIGEVDMYLKVDGNFKPVLVKFEVIDYNGNQKVKAGEVNL